MEMRGIRDYEAGKLDADHLLAHGGGPQVGPKSGLRWSSLASLVVSFLQWLLDGTGVRANDEVCR